MKSKTFHLAFAAATLALAAPLLAASATPVLPFVEGDYARALSQARGRRQPIFVEAWAPW